METPMSEPAIGEIGQDSSLSELEKGLLGKRCACSPRRAHGRSNSVSR